MHSPSENTPKLRYLVCGLSVRAIYHFVLPLLGKTQSEEDYSDVAEIVGIIDPDRERVEEFCRKIDREIPWFNPALGIQKIIEDAAPDALLVTGPDFTHCDYIIAGLENDLRVISEKPVVINCEEMKRVFEAERKSRGSLHVTHNFRYGDTSRRVKQLLLDKRIGRITNIEFVYNLDTNHGASYFFRWNRVRAKSGGLSIHKSVHHIDYINWLIESIPKSVFAYGALNYYGAKGAHRPKSSDGSALSPSQMREKCPYFQTNHGSRGVSPGKSPTTDWDKLSLPYATQYPQDRYIYDDEIDIEDTYSAVVQYRDGISMTYSCNFSTPWEGYTLAINGTEGRLEVYHHSNPDPSGSTPSPSEGDKIIIMPLFGGREEIIIPPPGGGHGGGDPLIRKDIFLSPTSESVRLKLPCSSHDAALAIAVGEGIWRSAKDGRPYTMKELLGEFYHSR
ncbi:MAG: Gfo/Idh/MocA family protein [Cumulibacter sp.]